MVQQTLSQVLMRYAVVIVEVRDELITWIRAHGFTKDYFPEEDGVWIVPHGVLAGKSPEMFLNEHAEALLAAEIDRYR